MERTVSSQATYWLGVVAVGLVLGLGIQFASAWTNPTSAPPEGNVPGPLTTGDTSQTKTGGLVLNTANTAQNGYGLVVNGFAMGTNGFCIGNDCKASWKQVVQDNTQVYYSAGGWFDFDCDGADHWSPEAECPTETFPVSCLLDWKDNGRMEDKSEYFAASWSAGFKHSSLNIVVPESSAGGSSRPANGACAMQYAGDSGNTWCGREARVRAVCMTAGSYKIKED